ncbi:hypothetical protein AB0H83_36770 [Dactylosporangium sp. NPDC050688]|uniref:hypothetical protein n=1 Tax=Dactylosporangium sp. NPDC050688 TaxID=3157217 RepID=UPI0033FED893
MAGPVLARTEPTARLVEAAEVGPHIEVVRRVFAELTDCLRSAPIEQLEARLRGWDNYQRASLGRGATPPLLARDIKSSFSSARTGFESRGEPVLPPETEVPALADLDEVVRLAARLAVPDVHDDDPLVVTLFLFRVIVRAGQRYQGFLHRDIDATDAPVGSVIFYPTVTSSNIDGANLGVHLSDRPTEELEGRDPDVTFAPHEYEHAAVVLGYPHNLAHGARPGINPNPAPPETATRTRDDNLREFLEPHGTTFWKDMAVLTFSRTSAIEDHIV